MPWIIWCPESRKSSYWNENSAYTFTALHTCAMSVLQPVHSAALQLKWAQIPLLRSVVDLLWTFWNAFNYTILRILFVGFQICVGVLYNLLWVCCWLSTIWWICCTACFYKKSNKVEFGNFVLCETLAYSHSFIHIYIFVCDDSWQIAAIYNNTVIYTWTS